ncbi:CoA transferase [Microbacterium sp. H83]|uniref:CoA transferase n=1 Tax=Microbacterium sp. H83 TaxID=1827324 RepID=UPI000B2E3AAC|nr:CoA transferase [Microbacterium sp. H83]
MSTPPLRSPSAALFHRVVTELGVAPERMIENRRPPYPVPLPSRLATADLAWASVDAVTALAGIRRSPDPDRIALAYRSDRVLSIDGAAPGVWSPSSGFWRAGDGWIRTHGNYPHHAAALLRGLGLSAGAGVDEIRAVVGTQSAGDSIRGIVAAGGLAVAVRPEDPDLDRRLRESPLLEVTRLEPTKRSSGPPRALGHLPLTGVRVLDLTRVIAGPVCTRTLALLGADVLRVDPPHLAEPAWQHLDTGHGKRSTILDARSPRFAALLAEADVVVLGYRPASLDGLGLSPARLAEQHPGLVIAQLSAWGLDHPRRAGFDSLVQAESGIALAESTDGTTPAALPAQALDHSAGYLLAASVLALVERRRREGGSWWVRTSLRRIAAELLGMPRHAARSPERAFDDTAHTARFRVDGQDVTTARPAVPGLEFSPPRPWDADHPEW